MAQKVKCVSRYVSTRGDLAYEEGRIYELSSSLVDWLMRDAPGCFELIPERKSMRRPPRNKAVQEPPQEK
jgi:hypothetical protein